MCIQTWPCPLEWHLASRFGHMGAPLRLVKGNTTIFSGISLDRSFKTHEPQEPCILITCHFPRLVPSLPSKFGQGKNKVRYPDVGRERAFFFPLWHRMQSAYHDPYTRRWVGYKKNGHLLYAVMKLWFPITCPMDANLTFLYAIKQCGQGHPDQDVKQEPSSHCCLWSPGPYPAFRALPCSNEMPSYVARA